MNEMFRIVESEDDIIAKEEKVFDDFLCAIDAEILGTDLIDINSVLSDYLVQSRPSKKVGRKKVSFQTHLLLNRSEIDLAKRKQL